MYNLKTILKILCHVSGVWCHLPGVRCHASLVMCHMSCIMCRVSPAPFTCDMSLTPYAR